MSKITTILFSIVLLAIVYTAPQANAWWYGNNMSEGADIIIDEVRWPFWPHGTYFALWNSYPYPQGGYFYGGVATHGNGGDEAHLELVWTFWDSPVYHPQGATPIIFGERAYGGPSYGEGSSSNVTGDLNFMRANHWYRFVMRTWKDAEKPDEVGYMGWWVKDLAKDHWHFVAVVRLPVQVDGIRGQAAFVEMIGPQGKRQIDRRNSYHHIDGNWHPTNWIVQRGDMAKNSTWENIEDGNVWRFTNEPHMENNAPRPHPDMEGWAYFPFENMPAKPALDAPEVGQLQAVRTDTDVMISWSVPEGAPPQLGYTAELLSADGTLLARRSENLPDVHCIRMPASSGVARVRLTLRDIYDQYVSAESSVESSLIRSAVEVSPTELASGVYFQKYVATDGTLWEKLPDFNAMTPVSEGYTRFLDESVAYGTTSSYGLVFKGYLYVPETGTYIFDLRSSDGSRLSINGQTVVENDGVHSAISQRNGIALETGYHPFQLEYFEQSLHGAKRRLSHRLWLGWEGPGLAMTQIADDDLLTPLDPTIPTFDLQVDVDQNNLATITPVFDLKGQTADEFKLELFTGNTRMDVIQSSNLSEGLKLPMPAGAQQIWARLWLNDKLSIESPIRTAHGLSPSESHWTQTAPGTRRTVGVVTSSDSVTILGEGEMTLTREVTGDFAITAKISDISLRNQANGIYPNARIGLVATAQGMPPFSIWHTASDQMRGTSSDRDLETSGVSRWPLGENQPWVRIVRRGNNFRAFASKDGQQWQLLMDRVIHHVPETLQVGTSFNATPHYSETLFTGTVENIVIEQPGPTETLEPTPAPDAETLFQGRSIAIIRSSGDDPKLYLRSYGEGVKVSSDQGKTWSQLAIPQEAKWVRSLAVHPKNPDVLLIGAGHATRDGQAKSGLWRSEDAGTTWQKITDAIDFRGDQPTVMCGEVISFDPFDPDFVVAGGDSTGLYRSDDAGKTWQRTAITDQRITVAKFSIREKHMLLIGTCADGEWGTPAGDRPGRIYRAWDRVNAHAIHFESDHVSINNIAFEIIYEGGHYLYFATTRGVYYCFDLRRFFLYRHNIATDTNYTAITSSPATRGVSDVFAAPLAVESGPSMYTGQVGYYWQVEWREINSEPQLRQVTSLIPTGDPPGSVLLLCNDQGVWRSEDGGQSWHHALDAGR